MVVINFHAFQFNLAFKTSYSAQVCWNKDFFPCIMPSGVVFPG